MSCGSGWAAAWDRCCAGGSGAWRASIIGATFPLGTLLINVSGTFLIGYLSVLFGVDWHDRYGHGAVLNAFVLTGVLGGYTTFSSMQLDAAKLAATSRGGLAASYLFVSVAAGLLAGALGAALARAQG